MPSENRILVDTRRVIGKIEPAIYGFNIEHINHDLTGSSIVYGAIFDEGSPLSDEHGYRKDVVEACKRIRVPMLRWPGGNFVSGYHWLNGVGPRDERPRLFELAWKSEESNRFGTDEFIEFCRLVDAEPWITVNAGSGTAEEACQWVEYCNRKGNTYYAKLREKNGHPEPYGVTYWSLGNELWGDFQIGHLSAEEYASKARDYAKLMRRVDPDIKLTAVGEILGTNPEWNLAVLNKMADLIDTISTHIYHRPLLSRDRHEDYYRIMVCPVHAEEKLKVLKGTIDLVLKRDRSMAIPPLQKREISISFDEWNMSGCHTLRDALGISRLLNVFQRLSDFVKIGSYFPLIHFHGTRKDRHGGAPISAYEDTCVLEAGYHAFDLYVNHTGEIAVDSYVESETYDLEFKARNGQDVSFKNIPYLDASATTSRDGNTLYLAVVNTHRDKDVECLMELRGCSPQKTGQVFELNAEDVDAFNDKDNKEHVRVVEKHGIDVAQSLTYTFPAHSATVIQIARA